MLACGAPLLGLAACGGSSQDSDEPSGTFTVDVVKAQFPSKQQLADSAQLTIVVRNAGNEKVPNVSVTLGGDGGSGGGGSAGTGAQGQGIAAFGYRSSQPDVQDPSRPIWVVDRGPDQLLQDKAPGGAELPQGPGGAATAYNNTWALGPLARGQVRTFAWDVVAVRPGDYKVTWRVDAGLDGKAVARLPNGTAPEGTFAVTVSSAAPQVKVQPDGTIVPASGQQ